MEAYGKSIKINSSIPFTKPREMLTVIYIILCDVLSLRTDLLIDISDIDILEKYGVYIKHNAAYDKADNYNISVSIRQLIYTLFTTYRDIESVVVPNIFIYQDIATPNTCDFTNYIEALSLELLPTNDRRCYIIRRKQHNV